MFTNTEDARSFTALTIDEIRWLNASDAFGEDPEPAHEGASPELVKSSSVPVPKNSRLRCYDDTRRRSILLDDFLGNNTPSRSLDSSRFAFSGASSPADSPPSSPEIPPSTPPRVSQGAWLYRRPRSPSMLSRSPSSLSNSPSSISRSSSSSRSVTPTPTRLRTPTGCRPRTPTPAVAEMNQSPFYTTVLPPQRSPSVRTGSPSSTTSQSSPNLLEFRASPRSRSRKFHPRLQPLQLTRERSGCSETSSILTTSTSASTSSLPSTPLSPSIYSQHSFTNPESDARPLPTRSIITLTPKRSPSISTKHSSKSVKFHNVAADREFAVGDGKVRGEEWNAHVVDDSMGLDMDTMDIFEGTGTQAPPSSGKSHTGALKRLLTLRSRKAKSRPGISGPYAPSPAPSVSQTSFSLPPPVRPRSTSSSYLIGTMGVLPSSPNGSHDLGFDFDVPKHKHAHKHKKPTSLLGPGDVGVLPDHGKFLQNKYHSLPARYRPSSSKAASITGSGSVGVLPNKPALHALPSMESFRSVKSSRSCGRFKGMLGRIGIGVAA